jgi:hypothetical protein
MGEPTSGSFSLPAGSEIEREFQQAYGACVDAGAAVHLTERHTALGPVVIDVDLRHAGSERVYTREHVKGFLDALVSVLVDYVSVPTVEVVLLEKAGPRLCDKPGGGYKDGWHIVLPNVVTHAAVQHASVGGGDAHFADPALGVGAVHFRVQHQLHFVAQSLGGLGLEGLFEFVQAGVAKLRRHG